MAYKIQRIILCKVCGKEVIALSPTQKYCPECKKLIDRERENKRSKLRLEYRKQWRKTHPELVKRARAKDYQKHYERIIKCNEKWRHEHPERYSEYQREWAKKWRHEHPERVKENDRKWRASHPEMIATKIARRCVRLEEAVIEKVSPEYIYKRDGWVCQLCGKKVNPKLKYPDPMSASIDHIIPLSKGGTHERKNLQLAHLKCNLKKNNGGHDQLRLIG